MPRLLALSVVLALQWSCVGNCPDAISRDNRVVRGASLLRLTIELHRASSDYHEVLVTLKNVSRSEGLWVNHNLDYGPFGNLSFYAFDVAGGDSCIPRTEPLWESDARAPERRDYIALDPGESITRVVAFPIDVCEKGDGTFVEMPSAGFRLVAEYRDRHGAPASPPSYGWFAGALRSNIVQLDAVGLEGQL